MTVITKQISQQYLDSLKRPPAARRLRGEVGVVDTPPVELTETKAQSLVAGSGLVIAAENVPVQIREDLINCTLYAQLAAGQKTSDPTDVTGWYNHYFNALALVGWVQTDTQYDEYKFKSNTVEAHREVIKVLTVVLGPQAAALVVVKSVFDGLQAMNPESPWITLFDRQSKVGKTARFQVATAQIVGGVVEIALVGFSLVTKGAQTQVLFFKWKGSSTRFTYAAGKAMIYDTVLAQYRNVVIDLARDLRDTALAEIKLAKAAGTKSRSTAAAKRGRSSRAKSPSRGSR